MASTDPRLPRGRVRTPTVIQMENVECGAAALGMILGHYGRFVPLEQLRRDCGVSRDGVSAANILAAARAHGLEARAFRTDIAQLRSVRYPYIVHFNFDHFVVVEGSRGTRVYLNDPETGPRVISLAEFDESFTGVILALTPGPEFQPGGEKPGILRAISRRMAGSQSTAALVLATALLTVLPNIIGPALVRVFIDQVLTRGVQDWARPVLIGLGLSTAAAAILLVVQNRILRAFQAKLAVEMSVQFVQRVLALPLAFYAQRYGIEIAGRVDLNDRIASLLSGRLATAAVELLVMGAYFLVMVRMDALLSAIALLFAALHVVVLRRSQQRRSDAAQRVNQLTAKLTGAEWGALQGMHNLKASALESDFFARWTGHLERTATALHRANLINARSAVLPSFLGALMAVAVLTVGALRVMDGRMTAGGLVSFQLLAAAFMLPVSSLVSLGGLVQTLQTDLTRIDDVLDCPVDPAAADHEGPPGKLDGSVELRNVSFGYGQLGAPLLQDVSLRVAPGAWVALVGASGSGKSTLLRLIAGLYTPSAGQVLLDGKSRREIPRAVLTASITMVDQDVRLFEGTVMENLTLWDGSMPEAPVIEACQAAGIHERLAELPSGYRSTLTEGAANLSGGERQRLEIAQCLASRPSILLLDEATSALDIETERIVSRNLRKAGCTTMIAAHRLSTVREADEILVLDRGRVVERGTHAVLMGLNGVYAGLVAGEAAC